MTLELLMASENANRQTRFMIYSIDKRYALGTLFVLCFFSLTGDCSKLANVFQAFMLVIALQSTLLSYIKQAGAPRRAGGRKGAQFNTEPHMHSKNWPVKLQRNIWSKLYTYI